MKSHSGSKLTDWIIAGSTIILAVITGIYVSCTNEMLQLTRQQITLSQDPVLSIEPPGMISGEIGEFSLLLRNRGLSEIIDINIYTDFFLCETDSLGNSSLTRFGAFYTTPYCEIPSIASQDTASFNLSFRETVVDMQSHISISPILTSMYVRITIEFRRGIDAKAFSLIMVYALTAHGDLLLDYSMRGLENPLGAPSMDEIKNILGADH